MKLFEKIFGTHSENELKRIYPSADEKTILQTACDYVSGMTDRYVLIKFEEIFLPSPLVQKNNDEFLFYFL